MKQFREIDDSGGDGAAIRIRHSANFNSIVFNIHHRNGETKIELDSEKTTELIKQLYRCLDSSDKDVIREYAKKEYHTDAD